MGGSASLLDGTATQQRGPPVAATGSEVMSTAKLNVWVTEVGNPCKIDMLHQWFVHVLHCDGKLLNWCEQKVYTNLKTKCGHLEIEIPPGCYMVCATWSPAPLGQSTPTSLGNHISHLATVRANCGDHVCVTLFPPTFHWCGIWWLTALQETVALKRLPRGADDAANNAVKAVDALLKLIPPDDFTKNMLEINQNRPK
jgi:hypothetical protein